MKKPATIHPMKNATTPAPPAPLPDEKVSFQWELMRKGIHLCSLSIPILYYYVPRSLALKVLIPGAAFFLGGDLLRLFHKPSFELYKRIFGRMLRTHEQLEHKRTFNGATWVLISALFCVLVFPKLIAITAFTILIISDTTAALVGRRFGTRKYRGKTLEGSTAFVASAAIVLLFTPKVAYLPAEFLIGVIAAIFGAIAEIFSFNVIDDNFAIPVTIGFTLWGMYLLFLPQLDVTVLDALIRL
jgi:dolichol kinase